MTLWNYRFEDGTVHPSKATDTRGLRLRSDCGYTHVQRTAGGPWETLANAAATLRFEQDMKPIQARAAAHGRRVVYGRAE